MRRCTLEAVFNACTVVSRIAFEIGASFNLFGEHDFAVNHRGAFTVTTA
jgi:hypothetical protein